jgi:indoleamine 2,3-dioxygenase
MNRAKGSYGLGRDVLPKQLAVPLVQIAEKIQAKPFMEYAMSYALYNYKRKDPSKPLDYDNLALIRKFSGMKSEHGFILVHVAMVRHTGELVKNVLSALEAAGNQDRTVFNNSMAAINKIMTTINGVMEEMWIKSLPEDYMKFRTFIMGITGQNEMFPNGVLYEGTDGARRSYRGESGANDR